MRPASLLLAALLVLATGCEHLRGQYDPRSFANTPCDGRILGALLGSEEPLTRDEIRYLQRCGVRFAAAE